MSTMIDLFSGCGGVTTGFKNKRFTVLAAVELDPIAAQTYRLNHPEVLLYEKDIRTVSPEAIMTQCNLDRGQLTVLSSCAPCQPFSVLNSYRDTSNDERVPLVLETLRFVEALYPVFLFVENVPGIRRDTALLDTLIGRLHELGYTTASTIINAADYGVPQLRKRFILLGTRLPVMLAIPEPTHAPPADAAWLKKSPWLTVKDAFAGLELLHAGEKSARDPLHKARNHTSLTLERLRHIPHNGGSRHSLPPELQLPRFRVNNDKTKFADVHGRLSFDRPSNTLTTGCTSVSKGRFAHPVLDRAITLREAARLQTFPDSYQFHGNYDQISAQIGNAVPVRLAEVFAQHFHTLADQACLP